MSKTRFMGNLSIVLIILLSYSILITVDFNIVRKTGYLHKFVPHFDDCHVSSREGQYYVYDPVKLVDKP